MQTKVFKSYGGSVWIQILAFAAIIPFSLWFLIWEASRSEPYEWVWGFGILAVGAAGLWFALAVPRTIALDDDGYLQLHSFRRMERLHATQIVEIRPRQQYLQVKLQSGKRYWNRDYTDLHELLAILKKHNPSIRLRGL